MKVLRRIWEKARKVARPFDSKIVKEEPAISSAAIGAAAYIAADLGFTLTPGESAFLAGLVLLAVGAFTRQSVTPVGKARRSGGKRKARRAADDGPRYVTDTAAYTAPVWQEKPDAEASSGSGRSG